MIFDYSDDSFYEQKLNRKQAIRRLEEMVNDNKLLLELFVANFAIVLEMITKNIFLNIESIHENVINDNNISEANTTLDTKNIGIDKDFTWPHIKGIFNIFYKLVQNNSFFVVKLQDYVSKDFITKV